MPDFNGMKPEPHVSNPNAFTYDKQSNTYTPKAMNTEYPRHVHRFVAVGQMNEYRVVQNDAERDAAVAEGWSLTPQSAPAAPPVIEDAPIAKAKKEKAA